MKHEDKELLLKDLCARLPYGLIVQEPDFYEFPFIPAIMQEVWYDNLEVKPYLRPMSSMTEEEKKECNKLRLAGGMAINVADYYDWLNKHHFDYRELIKKGLAIEAPKDMYK